MRRVSPEELKTIQLGILDVVTKFCDDNNISYWLDSGTLLGAIRHKGYIPWDDDIDLGMLRPDYDRFLATFNQGNDRYQAYSIENNPDFLYPHIKVLDTETILYEPDKNGLKLSINIDIFIYDNAPADPALLAKQYKRRDLFRYGHMARNLHHRPRGGIVRRMFVYGMRGFCRLFDKAFFVRKIVENSKKYNHTETGFVGNFTCETRMLCRKAVFDDFVEVEFEGKLYKAPVRYDEWLRAFYSDYMQLPPIEKRVSHHTFEAYVSD